MLSQHVALLIFLVLLVLLGGAIGAYIGIARARAPLNAPEPDEIHERRLRFRDAHLAQARAVLIAVAVLWLASAVLLVAANV